MGRLHPGGAAGNEALCEAQPARTSAALPYRLRSLIPTWLTQRAERGSAARNLDTPFPDTPKTTRVRAAASTLPGWIAGANHSTRACG